jgi:hypothetical protein
MVQAASVTVSAAAVHGHGDGVDDDQGGLAVRRH